MGWRHYWPAARRLRETGLSCIGAGRNVLTSGRTLMPPRTLGCHGLVFVTAGGGQFVDGEQARTTATTRFNAPCILWLFPGITHRYGPGPHGWTESWVLYDGIAATGHADLGVGDPARPVTPVDDLGGEVTQAFSALHRIAERPGRHSQVVAASLAHRLIGLAAELSQPSNHDARTLVEILEATSAENLTVAQRARRAGVGVTVLREQVLAETGLTPHEVVLRTRLARAQHLLTSSELSITQIATQVGYDDPAYFSRFFRARTGMAPQDFRQLP